MSSSDARMFEALVERVAALDEALLALSGRVVALGERLLVLAEAVHGKDVSPELNRMGKP